MSFDAKKETENIINFIREYYNKNNIKGAIVGLSGGKDSGVVAALFARAIGSENVIGVTMPCHSSEEDRLDAKLVADFYNIEIVNFDLTDTYDAFVKNVDKGINNSDLENSNINLKPRLRMATLYYLAALYSELKGSTYIVAGTSNKSELYVGYFTKGGDQVHDIEVISDFTVSEVIKIGEYLDVPRKVLYKTPSDGLSGKSDEDKLGVLYDDIEKYLYAKPLDPKIKEKIQYLHDRNKHKFNMPAYKRKKIGVFVGCFDPIHKGHIHVIKYLLEHRLVDKVLVIPTESYWSKKTEASSSDRVYMCKFLENESIEVAEEYSKLQYTYEIFEKLEEKYCADNLYLIIGADNIINFEKWKNVDRLLEYNIIVVNRDNIDIESYVSRFNKKDNFFIIDNFDYIPISSSHIRENIDEEEIKRYIDERVYKYIKEKGLYRKA